jgi:hypothetical protein
MPASRVRDLVTTRGRTRTSHLSCHLLVGELTMSKRSSKKNKSGSKTSKSKRRTVEKEAKAIIRASRTPRQRRPKNPQTKLSFNGLGINAGFSHTWATDVPAAIGNVTETSRKRHRFTVSETELIETITGNTSSVLATNNYIVNPGRVATFPWLAGLALKFELYKFTKLSFRWQPSCPTTETGNVLMSLDYDTQDTELTTEQELMAIPGAKMGSCFTGFVFNALAGGRSLFAKDLFISDSSTDVTKNLGKFYLGVVGTTSTTAIGRLYVDYAVELVIQQISADGVLGAPFFLARGSGAFTTTNPLAPCTMTSDSSNIGQIDDVSGTLYVRLYNPGVYFWRYGGVGSTITAAANDLVAVQANALAYEQVVSFVNGGTVATTYGIVRTRFSNVQLRPGNLVAAGGANFADFFLIPIMFADTDNTDKVRIAKLEKLLQELAQHEQDEEGSTMDYARSDRRLKHRSLGTLTG